MTDKIAKEMMNLIRKGDLEGVTTLYNLYYNKLYAIAFTITKNHHTSEDIVQNVVFKLLKVEKNLIPNENELAWLYKVVKNCAIDEVRRSSKLYYAEEMELLLSKKEIADYVNLNEFNDMLEGLDERRKSIITLKIVGEYTFVEISQMLDINVNTVRWLYNSGIKKLRNILGTIGIITIGFLLTFIINLLVVLIDIDFKMVYLVQGATLALGLGTIGTSEAVELLPSILILLYSGAMSLLFIIFSTFTYFNVYELSTKAKKKQ